MKRNRALQKKEEKMLTMWTMLASFIAKMRDEEGQGLAEYALILVLVAIVCVAALIFLGGSINNVLSCVASNISTQPGGGS
jgi:pilus assembly protein Flp/PilA